MTAGRPLVVVLGASGFIGSAVSRALATRPVRLRLVARREPTVPAGATAEVETLAVDLAVPGALAAAVAGADAVLHLVAYTEGGWRVADDDLVAERINLGLVHDLVTALGAGSVGRTPPAVLFTGTDTQVGLTESDRIDGTETDRPRSAYCRQKLAAENALKRATADGVLRGMTLRLPTVYGYGPESTADDRGVVSFMVRRALAGEKLTMWHDGTVRRDLVYVDDVVAALVAALDHVDGLAGGHWLIGTGQGEPLGPVFTTIAELVAARTGRPPVPVVTVPPPPHCEPTDLKSVEIDSSAFRAVTGWRPVVPLHEGLARTVTALADRVAAPTGSPGGPGAAGRPEPDRQPA